MGKHPAQSSKTARDLRAAVRKYRKHEQELGKLRAEVKERRKRDEVKPDVQAENSMHTLNLLNLQKMADQLRPKVFFVPSPPAIVFVLDHVRSGGTEIDSRIIAYDTFGNVLKPTPSDFLITETPKNLEITVPIGQCLPDNLEGLPAYFVIQIDTSLHSYAEFKRDVSVTAENLLREYNRPFTAT